jgi:hypothetical protein
MFASICSDECVELGEWNGDTFHSLSFYLPTPNLSTNKVATDVHVTVAVISDRSPIDCDRVAACKIATDFDHAPPDKQATTRIHNGACCWRLFCLAIFASARFCWCTTIWTVHEIFLWAMPDCRLAAKVELMLHFV